MKNDYPSFEDDTIREEYVKKIYNLFKEKNFNWDPLTSYFRPELKIPSRVFVRPMNNILYSNFPNVQKIGVNTEEGIIHLGIQGIHAFSTPDDYRKPLQEKGYTYRESPPWPGLFWLVKPLENLEAIVQELKDIEPILLQK